MAWLEPLVDGRSLFLYVRPLELQTADGLETIRTPGGAVGWN